MAVPQTERLNNASSLPGVSLLGFNTLIVFNLDLYRSYRKIVHAGEGCFVMVSGLTCPGRDAQTSKT